MTKSAPTEAPMPIPAFSPVLNPDLGSAVSVGRVVLEPCEEIVRAVGETSELKPAVIDE